MTLRRLRNLTEDDSKAIVQDFMVVCNSSPSVDAGGGTMMGVEERWYLGQECLPLYEK